MDEPSEGAAQRAQPLVALPRLPHCLAAGGGGGLLRHFAYTLASQALGGGAPSLEAFRDAQVAWATWGSPPPNHLLQQQLQWLAGQGSGAAQQLGGSAPVEYTLDDAPGAQVLEGTPLAAAWALPPAPLTPPPLQPLQPLLPLPPLQLRRGSKRRVAWGEEAGGAMAEEGGEPKLFARQRVAGGGVVAHCWDCGASHRALQCPLGGEEEEEEEEEGGQQGM